MSEPTVQPAPLLAMAALAALSLILAAWVRWFSPPERFAQQPSATHAVEGTLELRFIDLPDGAVSVERVSDGQQIAELAVGEGGFVRATLRSLVRERPKADAAQANPQSFRLHQTPQGQLWLTDPVSGRSLDLKAYGESNRKAFADLLLASTRAP